ncbi:MAG: gliding motility protein GldN, partial [Lentimicrobiaceae bacterium]|nr:gliding motility protein GldN [Lentimicrobiaceae bacterium]
MKKLNLILVFALASLLSYGQVVEGGTEEQKSTTMEPKPIREPIDGTYEVSNVKANKPIQLQHIREADVYWAALIWRVIDLRQKFNFPLYFPTEKKGNWKSFMQSILDAIDSTEANPTPLRIYTDEYVNIPYSITEMKSNMGETRVLPIYHPETFELIGDTTIFIDWGAKEVYRYVVKEQWRVDKQRSVMDQVIISICPMFWYEKQDSGGDDFSGDGGGGDFGSGDGGIDFGSEDDDDMPAMPTRRWREFGWIYYPEVRP